MTHNHNTYKPEQTLRAGTLLQRKIVGVTVSFRWASPGTFLMGSPMDEKDHWEHEAQHEVTLTQGFWVADTPTTQEFWQAVTGDNPSSFKGADQLPVENVSWFDSQDFVDKLNCSHSNDLPDGFKYAMPTESQWEYFCRAGTSTPFNFGSALNGDKANCCGLIPYGTRAMGKALRRTTPVGNYEPNAWGIYDTHGNVWEWVADWYAQDYYMNAAATLDPTGPDSGSERVRRGGSWSAPSKACRSAYRSSSEPDKRDASYGFRLVLVRK